MDEGTSLIEDQVTQQTYFVINMILVFDIYFTVIFFTPYCVMED